LNAVNLTNADLTEANLRGALLAEANLQGAVLVEADLMDADLTGANLTNARLDGAVGLTWEQLQLAAHLTAASLPRDLPRTLDHATHGLTVQPSGLPLEPAADESM